MRAYLAVSTAASASRLPSGLRKRVMDAAREALPMRDVSAGDWWESDDGGTALYAWTNEPSDPLLPSPLQERNGRVLGYCGYLGDPDKDVETLLTAGDIGPVASRLGGCFALFRAGRDGFEAVTSITRVCPVYHAELDGLRLAGSRALLVHLAGTGRVDLDVTALQPMVRHGFFTNDETPFTGVRALPNATTMTAHRGTVTRLVEEPLPEVGPVPRGRAEAFEQLSGLAEALLASAARMRRHSDPVRLALSGGRDSRLLAAVLHAADVPFRGRTHGFADAPDVVLGKRIARVLGIEHEVMLASRQENPQYIEVEHPLNRTVHVIRMCEGMNSAYENVGGREAFSLEPRTSGSGGEVLRGGFLYDQADTSPATMRRRVRSLFMAAEKFMTPEANAQAAEQHEKWDARAREDGFDTLDKLYLFYRAGRWSVGSHTATLAGSPYYHPFFDNRVVRAMLALPAEWRHSEEPLHRLIELLAPRLRDVPIEGKRWRFERVGPRRLTEFAAWRRRAALVASGGTSGFNWRKSYDENFQEILRSQVMEGPTEIFDIVGQAMASEHFAAVPKSWSQQTWHIYTLSVLLSGIWRQGDPGLPPVRIPVPR